jgi:hypothetical protein
VQGAEGLAVWRGTQGTYERSISDPSVTTLRKAERLGDRILADLSSPLRKVSLTLHKPGLAPGQTVRLVNPSWGVDEDFLVQATDISAVDPNGPEGGQMLMNVTLVDRFTPCYLRSPSASDLAHDVTDPTGGGGDCDCAREVVLLPAGMVEDITITHGRVPNLYYGNRDDGHPDQLVKLRCSLEMIWHVDATQGLGLYYHEPDTQTAVLAGKVAYRTADGTIRWDIAENVTAAAVQDRPRGWVVVDG